MTKSLEQIQQKNRKFILEAIYDCSYEEALKREVGDGCKILVKGKYRIYKNGKYECGEGLITMGSLEDEHIYLEKNIIYTAKFDFEDIIEIIGKPITLNRVLLALQSKQDVWNPKRYAICLGTTRLFYYDYSKNIELVLDLKLETLEEQSEETQRAINKLLIGK